MLLKLVIRYIAKDKLFHTFCWALVAGTSVLQCFRLCWQLLTKLPQYSAAVRHGRSISKGEYKPVLASTSMAISTRGSVARLETSEEAIISRSPSD